jgi:hypothetical protein
MIDIAFGLILYKILCALAFVLALPFVVNMFNGKGYGHNFKVIWGGFCRVLSFGMKKRTTE